MQMEGEWAKVLQFDFQLNPETQKKRNLKRGRPKSAALRNRLVPDDSARIEYFSRVLDFKCSGGGLGEITTPQEETRGITTRKLTRKNKVALGAVSETVVQMKEARIITPNTIQPAEKRMKSEQPSEGLRPTILVGKTGSKYVSADQKKTKFYKATSIAEITLNRLKENILRELDGRGKQLQQKAAVKRKDSHMLLLLNKFSGKSLGRPTQRPASFFYVSTAEESILTKLSEQLSEKTMKLDLRKTKIAAVNQFRPETGQEPELVSDDESFMHSISTPEPI